MPAGKLAAQAGHAFTDALCHALDTDPDRFWSYRKDGIGGSKVTLLTKNEAQLHRAYAEAIAAGLPAALITDEGHILPPHFLGQKIITALGIGPCKRSECRHITKKFRAA
jgi:PTH2 family peptidyl-tRNA hydrolase